MNCGTRSLAVALVVLGLAFPASAGTELVAPCRSHVQHGVLPPWLRGGFTGAAPRIPYAIGRRGAIAGILFGAPLSSPPAGGRDNKILWVPRRLAKHVAALWIRMQKMDGARLVGAPVRHIVATGPGPSLVEAPSPGCWRLTLTWSGRRDTLDLDYVTPS